MLPLYEAITPQLCESSYVDMNMQKARAIICQYDVPQTKGIPHIQALLQHKAVNPQAEVKQELNTTGLGLQPGLLE